MTTGRATPPVSVNGDSTSAARFDRRKAVLTEGFGATSASFFFARGFQPGPDAAARPELGRIDRRTAPARPGIVPRAALTRRATHQPSAGLIAGMPVRGNTAGQRPPRAHVHLKQDRRHRSSESGHMSDGISLPGFCRGRHAMASRVQPRQPGCADTRPEHRLDIHTPLRGHNVTPSPPTSGTLPPARWL